MGLERALAVLILGLGSPLLGQAAAPADSPPPAPPTRGPAAAPGAEAPRPGPSLRELLGLDLAAALEEARKLAGRAGAGREPKERLAALCILSGRSGEARALLGQLFAGGQGADPAAALAAAAGALAEQVRQQPGRKPGESYKPEEAAARVRLAALELASAGLAAGEKDDREWRRRAAEAREALSPLPPGEGFPETLRLGLLGLAASGSGERSEALRAFDQLYRRAAGETQLELRALALVDDVRSYGVYTERAAKPCRVGDPLVAYGEVLNFVPRQVELGGWLTALDVDLTFLEQKGEAPAGADRPPETRAVLHCKGYAQVRHRTRSEIRDLHLVIRFRVPPECVPGKDRLYALKVTVRDMATGKEAVSAPLDLPVEPPAK
jgi:hypothetical protein